MLATKQLFGMQLLLLCSSLATIRAALVVTGTTRVVTLIEGKKDSEPKYVLNKQYLNVLECSMYNTDGSQLEDAKIEWRREGSNETLDSRFEFDGKLSTDGKNFTSTFSVRRPESIHITNYTCTGTARNQAPAVGRAQLLSLPLISFRIGDDRKSDVAVWPDQDLEMSCVIEGNPPGAPEWRREKDGAIIGNGTASLTLKSVSYEEDRGFYSCRSNNTFGTNIAKIYLRVKHPQAYLTPLIIIIVEVIVIAIIVAAYEFVMYKKHKQADAAGESYKAD